MNNREVSSGDKHTHPKKQSNQAHHSYLEGLIGRMVTMYRGGPEKKTGTLLDVKSDYLTLYTNNKKKEDNKKENKNENEQNKEIPSVIYYQVHHVKSISEDTKNNSIQSLDMNENEEIDFCRAENFAGIFRQLKNESIQINQGGPESKKGIMAGITHDCIALFTEDDGMVYYNLHHIKSVCKHPRKNTDVEQNNANVIPRLVKASNFKDVFKQMSHKWVAINRGGPEAMEGVLVESSGGHYTLVSNQEVLRVTPFHVRNISSGPKGSLQQNKKNNNKKENQENISMELVVEEHTNDSIDEIQFMESSSQEESSERRSHRREERDRRSSRECVMKTIDYDWKY